MALFLAGPASAAFVGWTASVRTSGGYVLMDVFAGIDVATQHGLNVFNMNIGLTGGAALVPHKHHKI